MKAQRASNREVLAALNIPRKPRQQKQMQPYEFTDELPAEWWAEWADKRLEAAMRKHLAETLFTWKRQRLADDPEYLDSILQRAKVQAGVYLANRVRSGTHTSGATPADTQRQCFGVLKLYALDELFTLLNDGLPTRPVALEHGGATTAAYNEGIAHSGFSPYTQSAESYVLREPPERIQRTGRRKRYVFSGMLNTGLPASLARGVASGRAVTREDYATAHGMPAPCPGCGGAMPAPSSTKPRKWCSDACGRKARRSDRNLQGPKRKRP